MASQHVAISEQETKGPPIGGYEFNLQYRNYIHNRSQTTSRFTIDQVHESEMKESKSSIGDGIGNELMAFDDDDSGILNINEEYSSWELPSDNYDLGSESDTDTVLVDPETASQPYEDNDAPRDSENRDNIYFEDPSQEAEMRRHPIWLIDNVDPFDYSSKEEQIVNEYTRINGVANTVTTQNTSQ